MSNKELRDLKRTIELLEAYRDQLLAKGIGYPMLLLTAAIARLTKIYEEA